MPDESTRAKIPDAPGDQPEPPSNDDRIKWFLIHWIPPLLCCLIIVCALTGNLAAISDKIMVLAILVYSYYFPRK